MGGHCYLTLACTATFLLTVLQSTTQVSGHRCFVCAPSPRKAIDNQELGKMFGNTQIHKCSQYHRSRKHEFIQECPKESTGCLTKFEDGSVMRTCAPISVDDCKEANGVTYCYCRSPLCNTPDKKLSDPRSSFQKNTVSNHEEESDGLTINTASAQMSVSDHDDEDLLEGSGDYDDTYYPEDYHEEEEYADYSDQTDPPPFIVDETDLYKKPETEVVHKNHVEDIDFDDENNDQDYLDVKRKHHNRQHNYFNNAPKLNSGINILTISGLLVLLLQQLRNKV